MTRRMLTACLCLLLVGPLWAQPRGDSALLNQLQSRFESTAPAVGEPLPHIQVFDEKGQPFQLKNLKGSYTVLVFGCLT